MKARREAVSYTHLIKKSGKVDFGYYWWKGYFHPDSLMFRSSSINQKQKVFRNPLFNDNYITFVFSHSGKIYFLSDVMASYYETDNGIWNGQSRTVGLMRTLIIYEYISYVYGKMCIRDRSNPHHGLLWIFERRNGIICWTVP